MKYKLKVFFIFLIGFSFVFFSFTFSAKAFEHKKVLILNSYDQGLKWTRDIIKGAENILENKEDVELYYEFMDMKNLGKTKNYTELYESYYKIYKEKYSDFKFDAVICSDNDALDFMVKYDDELFKDCPIVFCGINDFQDSIIKGHNNFTGVIEEIDAKSTIESILKLQPKTKNIVVLCDSSTTGVINEKKVKNEANTYKNKVQFYFYKDVTVKNLYSNINKLGKDTVIFDVGQLKGEDGELIRYEKTEKFLAKIDLPIYVCWDFMVMDGIMGGKVIGGESQGQEAGKMVLRILKGENVENIPILRECPSKYVFNYNDLIKNKINMSNIPDDYNVVNAPISIYKKYKTIILSIVLIDLTLIGFIVLLMVINRKRLESEKKLRENYVELSAVYEELSATEEELREQYHELQKSEEKVKFLAYYDKLTKLPNATSFFSMLKEELEKIKEKGGKGAVFLIDVDNFKNINDTLGHDYGDELLKIISKEIEKVLNNGEKLFRIGGDEFLIIQPDIKDINDVKEIAQDILNIFKLPFIVRKKEVFVTASIGISIYPDDAKNETLIFKNADTAMYKAKEMGKSKYVFFNVHMFDDIMRKINLEEGLRQAIEKRELSLVFQPQISVLDGKVKGTEVLLRWNSSKFGFVSPAEFIHLAEETTLIVPIGKWVLKHACLKNKEWIDKGLGPITICVNVSVVQMYQEDFLEVVKKTLKDTGLSPEYLELEITESVLMQSLDRNLRILNELRDMGVKIALDDFGTGYSSLSYFRMLPINKLKLDKSFIDEIHIKDSDKPIVDSIIDLAHKRKIDVIAEGVEYEEQYKILKEMKCDEIQGYYFSRPLPEMEFQEYLKDNI